MSSFERILPFVRPIEHLLLDPGVTEVMVTVRERLTVTHGVQDAEAP